MFFVVESGELSVEVHGEPVSDDGPRRVFRRDRAHRPAAANGDRHGRDATWRPTACRSSSSGRSSRRARRSRGSSSSRWPTAWPSPSLVRRRDVLPSSSRSVSARSAIARKADRLRALDRLEHAAAEHDAAHARLGAARRDDAGRLPLGRRAVDLALARDRQVDAASRASNPTRSRTVGAPGTSSAPSAASAAPSPPAAPAPGQACVGRELLHLREAALEHRHGLRPSRPSAARTGGRRRRASSGRRRALSSAPELAHHLAQPSPTVDGRAAAEPDEERGRRVGERGQHQLAEPSARRDERIALVPARGAAARSRRRPRPRPGRPAAGASARVRPTERVGDDGLAPLAAERGVEDVGCSLAAVGHGQLDGLAPGCPHAAAERRGRGACARERP